jgi:hypothetical protein
VRPPPQIVHITYHHRDLETFCGEVDDRMKGVTEYDLVVRSEVKEADGTLCKLWLRFMRSPNVRPSVLLGAGIRAIVPSTLPRRVVEVPCGEKTIASTLYDLRNGWDLAEHEGKTFGHVLRAVTAG